MKMKYYRLSRSERKDALKRYKADSDANKLMYSRLRRVQFTCILGMLFGIGVSVYTLINHDSWLFVAEYGFLLVFCLVLFMFVNNALAKECNNFLIEETKKSKKEEDKKENKSKGKKSK